MKTIVLWGSKKLEVPCDPTLPVDEFLKTLEKLTGVPIERQKLSMRKKQLKPGTNWDPNDLKEGVKFMLIGTAELAPKIIDLPDEPIIMEENNNQIIFDPLNLVGLKNFGNTCYLNSVLEVFRFIPQLVEHIKKFSSEKPGANPLITQLAKLYTDFPTALPHLIIELRKLNPQFAEKDPQTQQYKQQDASECWGFIMNILRQHIGDKVSNLFEIDYEVTLEEPKHETQIMIETDDRLVCSINSETKSIEQGILNPTFVERKLPGEEEMFNWKQTTKISKLPKYLIVQMLRFTYRQDEQTTAKIVRRVQHPYKLDTIQWLASELRSQCVLARETNKKVGTGYYSLKAVLTHQGRTADSGHYISHIKHGETWYRYDDDKVKELEDEEMDLLFGSGDWHCSFLLINEKI